MLTEYEQAKEDNDRPKMVARISPPPFHLHILDAFFSDPLASLEAPQAAYGRG